MCFIHFIFVVCAYVRVSEHDCTYDFSSLPCRISIVITVVERSSLTFLYLWFRSCENYVSWTRNTEISGNFHSSMLQKKKKRRKLKKMKKHTHPSLLSAAAVRVHFGVIFRIRPRFPFSKLNKLKLKRARAHLRGCPSKYVCMHFFFLGRTWNHNTVFTVS